MVKLFYKLEMLLMKKIIYFYLPLCPFCHEADQYLKESINENARFKELEIIRINEAKEVKVANSYDYYYVPCFWLDQQKIHEGPVTKAKIKEILLMALE